MHRRRREQKTYYRKRLGLVKSGLPRLVIRRSLDNIKVQFVFYKPEGDMTIAAAVSQELKGFPTGNVPASYLTGLAAGKRALAKGINNAVLDIGLQTSTKGSRIYAALKGVVDSGINVPHSSEVFPKEDRIKGKHIKLEKQFEDMKQKIISGGI